MTKPNDPKTSRPPAAYKAGLFARSRTNFLAGLVVILPLALTIWLVWAFFGWIDGVVLPFVPDAYEPTALVRRFFGVDWEINVRGVGVVVLLLFTIFVGWVVKGVIGRGFLRYIQSLVDRMPVVRSIYNGAKQIAETVFAQSDNSFDTACMVEYPRKGIWAIAFISTSTKGEVADKSYGGPMTSVFLPTTPNPTSGFLLFVPSEDIIELTMSVEDAAKLVISAGLVYPDGAGGVSDTPQIDSFPDAAE